MHILIVNAFIREAVGDAALLSVMIDHTREAFPDATITVSSLNDAVTHPEFDGCTNIGSMRRYGADESVPRWRRAFRKTLVAALPLLSRLVDPTGVVRALLPAEVRRETQAIGRSDIVVSVGGGYLNGEAGLVGDLSVANMLAPLAVAHALGKAVLCGPQSFGPFRSARQVAMVRRVLSEADVVILRESKSLAILQDLGVPGERLVLATDSAFGFGAGRDFDWRRALDIDPGQRLVGITARQWFDHETQELFEKQLAYFIDELQQRGLTAVLIPQVISELAGEDDRDVNRRILDRCQSRTGVRLVEEFDHEHAKSLYRELDYVVGMRFHSVIFALTSGVPAIAIEYHHKASGIMADLGLSAWVISTESVMQGGLLALFERLEPERERYLSIQEAGVADLVARAATVPEILRAAVARPCGS